MGVETGFTERALVPSARLQVGADALAGSFAEFRELTQTRVDDGLDFFTRLPRYGRLAVQILVDKQTNEHLPPKESDQVEPQGQQRHALHLR